MAANNNSKATGGATLGETPVACHQHDDWLVPAAKGDGNAQFASMVMDVARGTRVIASILCAHVVDGSAIATGSESVRPLLSANDTEALARLAVRSLDHLYRLSEDQVDALNAAANYGGQV